MGVDLHRGNDLAVSQDLHGDSRVYVHRREETSAGVACVMNPDAPDAGQTTCPVLVENDVET
jgi:hypothetical protein